jgi:hypothetical protein
VTNYNTTGFTQEQFDRLLTQGYSVQEIESLYARMEYRREYNARPERKAYHKAYNARKNAKERAMKKILRGQ